jgi:hypothetical protein
MSALQREASASRGLSAIRDLIQAINFQTSSSRFTISP